MGQSSKWAMSLGTWVGEVVHAVQASNTSKLLACLNARNELAQACLHRAQFTPEQLKQVAQGKFRNARATEADKWGTVASEHLLALQLSQQGKHVVRHTFQSPSRRCRHCNAVTSRGLRISRSQQCTIASASA